MIGACLPATHLCILPDRTRVPWPVCPWSLSFIHGPAIPDMRQDPRKKMWKQPGRLTMAIFDPFNNVFPSEFETIPSSVTWLENARNQWLILCGGYERLDLATSVLQSLDWGVESHRSSEVSAG